MATVYSMTGHKSSVFFSFVLYSSSFDANHRGWRRRIALEVSCLFFSSFFLYPLAVAISAASSQHLLYAGQIRRSGVGGVECCGSYRRWWGSGVSVAAAVAVDPAQKSIRPSNWLSRKEGNKKKNTGTSFNIISNDPQAANWAGEKNRSLYGGRKYIFKIQKKKKVVEVGGGFYFSLFF